MKNKLLLCFALFLRIITIEAQSDYNNAALQKAQWATVTKVLKFIESKSVDSALTYIDSTFISENSGFRKKLTEISNTINKVYANCGSPLGPITFDNKFNIYICAYRKLPITYARFEFYMNEGQPNSKIMKLRIQTQKELEEERKQKKKKNNEENEIPPPPPTIR